VFDPIWRNVSVELRKTFSSAVLFSVFLLGGFLLAGCDDNVEVIRDPEVHIAKGMTWAWRSPVPLGTVQRASDGRPITSRDVIRPEDPPPTQTLESNRDWNTEANRTQLQTAIERALNSKGLREVSNPDRADILVDYHIAVKNQSAIVQRVYPGYPGCGPYGCWGGYGFYRGWGWGPPEVQYQSVRWHEGTFVLDLAMSDSQKLAYRAISRKELNNKRTISPYQAEEAVNHLLKGLKTKA
jgi:Domain of unknown function (DUF4136)